MDKVQHQKRRIAKMGILICMSLHMRPIQCVPRFYSLYRDLNQSISRLNGECFRRFNGQSNTVFTTLNFCFLENFPIFRETLKNLNKFRLKYVYLQIRIWLVCLLFLRFVYQQSYFDLLFAGKKKQYIICTNISYK